MHRHKCDGREQTDSPSWLCKYFNSTFSFPARARAFLLSMFNDKAAFENKLLDTINF